MSKKYFVKVSYISVYSDEKRIFENYILSMDFTDDFYSNSELEHMISNKIFSRSQIHETRSLVIESLTPI